MKNDSEFWQRSCKTWRIINGMKDAIERRRYLLSILVSLEREKLLTEQAGHPQTLIIYPEDKLLARNDLEYVTGNLATAKYRKLRAVSKESYDNEQRRVYEIALMIARGLNPRCTTYQLSQATKLLEKARCLLQRKN